MQKNVLIIEDDENNMELIAFILQNYGFQTIKAWTGQQGIDQALTERPDFIILDIQLPDMDGEMVLQTIRRRDTDNNIPIIAMTSYAMSGDRERLLTAGCNGYIEKPIDPEKVTAQIEEILGNQSHQESAGER